MLLLALLPTSALAGTGGSSSVATATAVTYGQQEFGNTATGQYLEGSCGFDNGGYRSYWALGVLAGDLVTINWEGTPGTRLELMPVGTTDYTLFQTNPALYQDLTSNGKNQALYTAPVTGLMPLYFRVCQYSGEVPGPYDFIATDQHALVAGLAPYSRVKRTTVIAGTAFLADGTPVPDGLVFHLVVKWHTGRVVYRALSSAGTLSFQLALPPEAAGQVTRLVITRGADTNYQAIKSSPQKVVVARGIHPRHHHRQHRH